MGDSDFVKNVGQHLYCEKTYKIVLEPERTETVDGGLNRFLPKDFFRDFLIKKVKSLAMSNGFKIKMPYADRVDKSHSTRTINFYCHMSKSANRKILTNSCPFRAIFKMKMGCLKQQIDEVKHKCSDFIQLLQTIDWQKVFELHKLFNLHNHEMINYKTLQTVKHPISSTVGL